MTDKPKNSRIFFNLGEEDYARIQGEVLPYESPNQCARRLLVSSLSTGEPSTEEYVHSFESALRKCGFLKGGESISRNPEHPTVSRRILLFFYDKMLILIPKGAILLLQANNHGVILHASQSTQIENGQSSQMNFDTYVVQWMLSVSSPVFYGLSEERLHQHAEVLLAAIEEYADYEAIEFLQNLNDDIATMLLRQISQLKYENSHPQNAVWTQLPGTFWEYPAGKTTGTFRFTTNQGPVIEFTKNCPKDDGDNVFRLNRVYIESSCVPPLDGEEEVLEKELDTEDEDEETA